MSPFPASTKTAINGRVRRASGVIDLCVSEAEYEKMKANDGQPLHVWQLDFSALAPESRFRN